MTKNTKFYLITVGALLLMALMLGACAQETPTEAPPTKVPPPPPTAVPLPDQSAYHAAVSALDHNTYSEYSAPNTYCARCHSPQNWDPEASYGPPPACWTCKFATDDEIRIADNNPLIPEDEWVGVPCETCHIVDSNGIAGKNAWLNPISMEYEEVNTPTELCEMCHVSTAGGSFGRVAGSRGIDLGGSAHIKYAGTLGDTPPQYCTDCHDPHSQELTTCEDCHTGVRDSATHMKGYNSVMLDKVSCIACHDASGADVGPNPDDETGPWTTTETTTARGSTTTSAILSHSIQWSVACDRCHSKENAYGLSTRDSAGEPVEETICVDDEAMTVLYDKLDTYGVVDVDYTLGECPTETICVDDETLTVLVSELDTYGALDVDYTLGECPTDE